MKFCTLILLNLLVVLSPACQSHRTSERSRSADDEPLRWDIQRPPPSTQTTAMQPLPVTPRPTVVRQGTPPLVYLIEGGEVVVIVTDVSTNSQLARAPARGPVIVRIDPRAGIYLGKTLISPGPLAAHHRYSISLEVEQPSVIETQLQQPSTSVSKHQG